MRSWQAGKCAGRRGASRTAGCRQAGRHRTGCGDDHYDDQGRKRRRRAQRARHRDDSALAGSHWGAEVGGYRVAAVLVDVGTKVKKGQVLVQLAGDMLQADLDSKRAAMRSAEAAEINASAALRRGEQVRSSGALSAADLDRLQSEHVAAQARVDTASADLRTAELRSQYASVRAPDSGTVTSRTVSVGRSRRPGRRCCACCARTASNGAPKSLRHCCPDPGRPVRHGNRACDGITVQGKVRAVAPTVQTNNRTGLVYVDITGGDARAGHVRARRDRCRQGSGAAAASHQRRDAGWLQLCVRRQ